LEDLGDRRVKSQCFKKILNAWVSVDGKCLVTSMIGIIIVEHFGSTVREIVLNAYTS
jgi:hypothetical protein